MKTKSPASINKENMRFTIENQNLRARLNQMKNLNKCLMNALQSINGSFDLSTSQILSTFQKNSRNVRHNRSKLSSTKIRSIESNMRCPSVDISSIQSVTESLNSGTHDSDLLTSDETESGVSNMIQLVFYTIFWSSFSQFLFKIGNFSPMLYIFINFESKSIHRIQHWFLQRHPIHYHSPVMIHHIKPRQHRCHKVHL